MDVFATNRKLQLRFSSISHYSRVPRRSTHNATILEPNTNIFARNKESLHTVFKITSLMDLWQVSITTGQAAVCYD